MRLILASTIFVLSCTSSSKSSHKPMGELSLDKREVIEAFRAGGDDWERMRDHVIEQPELARFVVNNMIDQMFRSYRGAQLSTEIRKEGPFERAQSELVALSEHSIPVLVELLDAEVSDSVGAFLAADTLSRIGVDALPSIIVKLDSPSAETRRRALAVLAEEAFALEEGSPGERALFARVRSLALEDPEWIVRAEAAATLALRGSRLQDRSDERQALIRGLVDEDDDVRCSVERALGQLGDARAFPALIEVLAREIDAGNPRNMAAARLSMVELAQDPRLGQKARGMSIRDWRQYWQRERVRLLDGRREKP